MYEAFLLIIKNMLVFFSGMFQISWLNSSGSQQQLNSNNAHVYNAFMHRVVISMTENCNLANLDTLLSFFSILSLNITLNNQLHQLMSWELSFFKNNIHSLLERVVNILLVLATSHTNNYWLIN